MSNAASGFVDPSTTKIVGTGGGTVEWAQPFKGIYKKVVVILDGYFVTPDTTTPQSFTFPVAFKYPPIILSQPAGIGVTVTGTNMGLPLVTTPTSGVVVLEGV